MTTNTEAPDKLPTDSAILRALRASIERFGVLVPIVFDQHRDLIDGHHRLLLADELDLLCPEVTVTLPDDPGERAQAIIDINDARRQKLTADQRRDIAKALRERGHSTRAIAAVVGASKSAVDRDLQQLSHAGQLETPVAVTGLDGRTPPAARPASEPEPAPKPKPKPKAEPKPMPEAAPTPAPTEPEARRFWLRLSGGVRDIRDMRGEATKMLQELSPEQVWRLAEANTGRSDRYGVGGHPDQVGEDVLIELDKAALELSFTVSYLTARLLRPDQPESWGKKPDGLDPKDWQR